MASARLRLLGFVVALTLGATACNGGDNRAVDGGRGPLGGSTVGAAATKTKAVELRAGLTYLLVEDVDLVGLAVGALTKGAAGPAVAGATRALDDNGRAVARALASADPTTQALLLDSGRRRHAALLAEGAGRRAHDPARTAAARAALAGQDASFAALVHASSPALAVAAVTVGLRGATASLLAAVDAGAVDDPDAPELLAAAAGRARQTASLLAAGIAADRRLGSTTTRAAGVRAELTALLVEHVYGVAASTAPGPGHGSAARALDHGSVALAKVLARSHPEVEAPLLATWREHIDFLRRYAGARGRHDATAATAAQRSLDGDRRSFGATVQQGVPQLPADIIAGELIPHIAALLTALDDLVEGDPDLPLALRAAAAAMPGLAAVLAGGLAEDEQLS